MTKTWLAGLAAVAVTAIVTVSVYQLHSTGEASSSSGRKILYYRDPMHPSYTSAKPGKAPDCGMELEPVYADRANSVPGVA